MRIPDRIKIGCNEFTVEWRDELDAAGNIGLSSVSLNKIYMARRTKDSVGGVVVEMPEPVLVDTFLHEVLHSLSCLYGLKLKERQIEGLAGGLMQVIRDNALDFR